MKVRFWGIVLTFAFATLASAGDVEIRLKENWVDTYRNRVLISTAMTVDKAGNVHPVSQDGDMHFSGRSDDIQLPTVAEIMNAANVRTSVQAIVNAQGGAPIQVSGFWRLWPEHPGNDGLVFEQRAGLQAFSDSNPDHVMEIHPLVRVGTTSVLSTLAPIPPAYRVKDPVTAFHFYENMPCHIKLDNGTYTIKTRSIGYNYVKFVAKPNIADINETVDGLFVPANIYSTEGELLKKRLYLALAIDTPAYRSIKDMQASHSSKALTLLGLPRISLQRVHWRAVELQRADPANHLPRPEALDWSLPYEMIIGGLYGDYTGELEYDN